MYSSDGEKLIDFVESDSSVTFPFTHRRFLFECITWQCSVAFSASVYLHVKPASRSLRWASACRGEASLLFLPISPKTNMINPSVRSQPYRRRYIPGLTLGGSGPEIFHIYPYFIFSTVLTSPPYDVYLIPVILYGSAYVSLVLKGL